jgi:FtsH-binding integral membrane protein
MKGSSTMSDFNRNPGTVWGRPASRAETTAVIDSGLRAYMLQVYNYMAIGLAITGLAALGVYMASVTGDPTTAARTASFGALSLYGYTTKRDLSGMGSFLIMGLFGLIIASLVNLFLQSSMMQFIVSVVGVLIFAGLTAWDTQRLKNEYVYGGMDGEMAERSAIMGALSLYLNFINLFTFLLQLLGQKNE